MDAISCALKQNESFGVFLANSMRVFGFADFGG